MKIIEAIERIDDLKPNSYEQEDKIEWLSHLDGIIKVEIIDTHEGYENVHFTGYSKRTNTDTELLVGAPYDEIYILWLMAQIDFSNGENSKYNSSMSLFQSKMTEYRNWYNRTHTPLNTNMKYW